MYLIKQKNRSVPICKGVNELKLEPSSPNKHEYCGFSQSLPLTIEKTNCIKKTNSIAKPNNIDSL